MKLLFSGGHLTPALAMIDEAHAQGDDVVFVGRTHSQSQQRSHEESEVSGRGVRFVPFASGKLARWQPNEAIKQLRQFWLGLSRARQILIQEKPNVFVSFGGYLAVPLAIAAWRLHIPVVTHEQTRTAGVANRIIALFAKKVAVSFPETLRLFPTAKTVLTGNPVRQVVFQPNLPAPSWYHFSSLPILYITGGSQGSQAMNEIVVQTLPVLTQTWYVVHACGKNYREQLEVAHRQLAHHQQENYYVREWLSERELGWIYQHVTCIVARAGANTVAEVTRAGKPAVFIPLPAARHNEQYHNATALEKVGAAIILPQTQLTAESFLHTLKRFLERHTTMLSAAQKHQHGFEVHAALRFYQVIQSAVHES